MESVRASPRSGSQPLPTFHDYAEDWWLRHERRLRPKTQSDYRWRLEKHLLPFFKDYPLDAITFDAVERYIAAKLAEDDPLSARSINMTVILLGAIMEGAVERELIERNPARGRGRRVRERAPRRSYLDTAAQISALLDAGWLRVGEAKTDAGTRQIRLRPTLKAELEPIRRARAEADPDDFIFATSTGKRQSTDNLRSRVIAASVEQANKNLRARDLPPLPEGITPHSLRRTFASVLYAIGEDPGVVMDEMVHTDPALALRVYRQSMRRGDDEKAALRALVEGKHA